MTDRVVHSGTKGMRWGVRKYQNPDGSLTDAGKKRYGSGVGDKSDAELAETVKRKNLEKAYAKATDNGRLDKSKKLADASKTAADNLRELERKIPSRKKSSSNLSNMSDKEMRDRINRRLLEKQYDDMFNSNNVSRGRDRLRSVLEVGGAVIGVTSSALGIALAIKELRG